MSSNLIATEDAAWDRDEAGPPDHDLAVRLYGEVADEVASRRILGDQDAVAGERRIERAVRVEAGDGDPLAGGRDGFVEIRAGDDDVAVGRQGHPGCPIANADQRLAVFREGIVERAVAFKSGQREASFAAGTGDDDSSVRLDGDLAGRPRRGR